MPHVMLDWRQHSLRVAHVKELAEKLPDGKRGRLQDGGEDPAATGLPGPVVADPLQGGRVHQLTIVQIYHEVMVSQEISS